MRFSGLGALKARGGDSPQARERKRIRGALKRPPRPRKIPYMRADLAGMHTHPLT